MPKEKIETRQWDASRYLKTEEDITYYLEAAFEEGDPALITMAIGNIAKVRGMTQIANQAGVGRTSLYKTLSEDGKPQFSTILKVLDSFGLKLKVVPK